MGRKIFIQSQPKIYVSVTALILLSLVVILASPFAPKTQAVGWPGWGGINTIYYNAAQDNATNKFLVKAAAELRDNLQKTGKTLTITTASRPVSGSIYLEVNPAHPELAGRGDEAFKLYADANGIYITGKTALAVRHGAYALLEKLGFRWFFEHAAWWVKPAVLISLED